MSELTATNCGCGCDNGSNDCGNLIWILLLLSCCGNGTSLLSNNGDNGCCNLIWILLLLSNCCGNGNGCGIF